MPRLCWIAEEAFEKQGAATNAMGTLCSSGGTTRWSTNWPYHHQHASAPRGNAAFLHDDFNERGKTEKIYAVCDSMHAGQKYAQVRIPG